MSKEEQNTTSIKILAIVCLGILTSLNLLFILFFIGVSRVDALQFGTGVNNETYYSYLDLTAIERGYFRGCTSTTSCFSTSYGSQNEHGKLWNTSNVANDSKGLMFYIIPTDITIRKGQIYSATGLYCGSSRGTPDLYIWTGNNYTSGNITISDDIYHTYKEMDDITLNHTSNVGCTMIYSVFKAEQSGAVIGYQLRSSTTTSSTLHFLVGYNITELSPLDYVTVSAFNSGVTSINNNTNTKITNVITEIQSTKTAILNQMNTNTQSTNNAINEASQNEINSQQVCTYIDINSIEINGKILDNTGAEVVPGTPANWGITNYINIVGAKIIYKRKLENGYVSAAFYDTNKRFISRVNLNEFNVGDEIPIPNNAQYFRSTINKDLNGLDGNKPQFQICKNGNQAMYEQNNEDNWQQEDPDKSGQDDLEDEESVLDTYLANDSDLDALTIDVQPQDNVFIWDIFDRIVTGNTIIYSTFITILVFGVIKTILAR